MKTRKPIIYQLLPRLFANYNDACIPWGSIEQNGSGKMNSITDRVLEQINDLGATHVWLTGVIEHAHTADYTAHGIARHNPHIVKGKAGSPYAIVDYYDIDPDIAVDVDKRMEEFEALVQRIHKAGMKVIIDFVPNHVSREYHSDAAPAGIADLGANDDNTVYFGPNNNFYYIPRQLFAPSEVDLGSGSEAYVEFPARATGNDCFTAFPGKLDWYETVKLNYGVDYGDNSRHFSPIPDTWLKMLHILRFWAGKGVDGFRCDMAHMVPVEFWKWAIANVKEHYPDIIFIAEIYEVGLYRTYIYEGGFDYLYDKVNLYDTLRAIQTSNCSAAQLTSCWQTVDGISHHMLNFLENHDEQRYGSPQYMGDPAKVIPALVVSAMMGTGAMMIYAGQELGEQGNDSEGYSGRDGRTTIFDYWSLSTLRRWLNGGKCSLSGLTPQEQALRGRYRSILRMAHSEPAIAKGRFFDLMYVNYHMLNPHRHYAFVRSYADDVLVVVANFDSSPAAIKLNMPRHAFDTLDIPQGECVATELLSGDKMRRTLTDSEPFDAGLVGAYDAVVWKFDKKALLNRRPDNQPKL